MHIQQATSVLSQLFAQHLFRAVATSILSISFALAVTRCLPRIPSKIRSLFWWLILTKCLVSTVCDINVPIPVIPATKPVVEQVRVYAAYPLPAHIHFKLPAMQLGSSGNKITENEVSQSHPVIKPVSSPSLFNIPFCLFLIWITGVMLISISRIKACLKIRAILRGAEKQVPEEIAADLSELARALCMSRTPRLFVSCLAQTPFACGIVKPSIVLPVATGSLSRTELRMTLAHELAHIKRFDPIMGLIPELTRIVFFFNPLVYLAVHEYMVAREEACDRAALTVTSAHPRSYAELLLRHIVKLNWSPGPLTTATMSSAHRAMKRRLLSLKTAASSNSPRRLLALQACLPLIVIPWQTTLRAIPTAIIPSLPNIPLVTSYLPVLMSGSGMNLTNATSINYSGDVVGVAKTKAVLWQGNALVPLTSGDRYRISVPSGISDSGMIVGSQYNNPEKMHGLTWTPTGHLLPSVQGFRYVEPVAVNGAGDVAGDARSGTRDHFGAVNSHAFLLKNGQMTDLGTLGGPHSCALGINGTDTVVGKSDVNSGFIGSIDRVAPQTHAFVWIAGQMKDLGTFGGPNSSAYSVSNTGEIAGFADTIYGTGHAFVYQSGVMHDLDTLPGDDTSSAMCVNDRGQVVGYSDNQDVNNGQKAVLWMNGTMVDLNSLLPKNSGWDLQSAHGINDKGEIVGRGTYHGRKSGFLLIPSATQ